MITAVCKMPQINHLREIAKPSALLFVLEMCPFPYQGVWLKVI